MFQRETHAREEKIDREYSLILAKNNKAGEIPASRETRSTLPLRVLLVIHDVFYHSLLFFAQIRDCSVCSVREKEKEVDFATSREINSLFVAF